MGAIFKLCWCPRYLSIYTFASIPVSQKAIVATALTLLLLTIPIDPHNCRPIVGPIAYSMAYYPGYKKELNGMQTGRSKTLQA